MQSTSSAAGSATRSMAQHFTSLPGGNHSLLGATMHRVGTHWGQQEGRTQNLSFSTQQTATKAFLKQIFMYVICSYYLEHDGSAK